MSSACAQIGARGASQQNGGGGVNSTWSRVKITSEAARWSRASCALASLRFRDINSIRRKTCHVIHCKFSHPSSKVQTKNSQTSSCNRCTFKLEPYAQMRRKNSICVSSMRKEQLCQLGATSVTAHAPLFASLNTHIHTSHISSNESCNGQAGMLQLPYLLQST